ncbi:MAG TPA: C40 family peptidase [Micromonosporaceae bacterium]|nr:C40 family peptidase [Micromonosporaceae bacterium]
MTLQPGGQALVSVAVATLWSSPDVVRTTDTPALRSPVDIRTWVESLGEADRTGGVPRVLTQLLLGERVLVDQIRDSWVRVFATEQASSLDSRGYPGWVSADQLTGQPLDSGEDLVVDATATALRDAPFGDIVLYGVALGTRLTGTGASYRGWSQVLVPASAEPAWVRSADVVPAPDGSASAEDVLQLAERLLDAPYVWGGLSGYGIDCSGLVHLACRRYGAWVPRDAQDQADAAKEIPLDDAAPGDLYFFARPDAKIHHVGVVAGRRRMVHASAQDGRVVLEALAGERAKTLVCARRVLP